MKKDEGRKEGRKIKIGKLGVMGKDYK
jgi:hypothetical protein